MYMQISTSGRAKWGHLEQVPGLREVPKLPAWRLGQETPERLKDLPLHQGVRARMCIAPSLGITLPGRPPGSAANDIRWECGADSQQVPSDLQQYDGQNQWFAAVESAVWGGDPPKVCFLYGEVTVHKCVWMTPHKCLCCMGDDHPQVCVLCEEMADCPSYVWA